MEALKYERLVVAYHGCDRRTRDAILTGHGGLKKSENDYDWLGSGIYFWEYGAERAKEWAVVQKKRGRLSEPAVLGAVIHLGNCFDLLDTGFTKFLEDAYPSFIGILEASGKSVPANIPLTANDGDSLLRRGDCAMINWTVDQYEKAFNLTCHAVRGLFQEGAPAFPGSSIKRKSHIQIAVRDTSCILGYFLPR